MEITEADYASAPTRVLKAHRLAVESALRDNLRLLQEGQRDQACTNIAEAVLTALDTKPAYVVVVIDGSATHPYLTYGPYATYKTAVKAIESGTMGTHPGARAVGIVPLLKAPRRGQ